jgi:Fur family peroxide stress response transcriptional regulator
VTPQRLAIYRLLLDTERHPTAQMIYEELQPQFPSLSLATVYNTLEKLVETGVVNALGAAGDSAVHYDGDTEPHVNLACISCHLVIDLPSQHVQALDQEVAASSGYQLLGARPVLTVYARVPDQTIKNHRNARLPGRSGQEAFALARSPKILPGFAVDEILSRYFVTCQEGINY